MSRSVGLANTGIHLGRGFKGSIDGRKWYNQESRAA